jgi:hypothetical protein
VNPFPGPHVGGIVVDFAASFIVSQAILLRLHRWVTLIFALPLVVIIGTGLVLSFEPIAQLRGPERGVLNLPAIEKLLSAHDPEGKASGLAVRAYDNATVISGVGEDPVEVDLATGVENDDDGWSWSELFGMARRWHEHLIFDLGWLVTASTIAMLGLAIIGILMGWPRLRMSVSGWHKGIAWFTLPLVILSPLTGLAIAFGITFSSGFGGARPPALPLKQALAVVAKDHDLSSLIWLRSRGGRQLARLYENGEMRVYQVTAQGLIPAARNWPRLIHEGNWAGVWSALINVVTSLSLIGLLGTGLYLWASRKLRKRNPRERRGQAESPTAA